MNFHHHFSKATRPAETCVVGTGGFGRTFLAQAPHVPLLNARIAVDISAERAAEALRAAGIAEDRIRICGSAEAAEAAWSSGCFVAAGDLAHTIDLPFDMLIEATGDPEAGARHADLALQAGRHLAIVSKEMDSVVGPYLAHAAAQRGMVATPVDGDQPSLLIGLITWAETLGLEIVAAGKSSEYDFVFDPASGTVEVNGVTAAAPGLAEAWTTGGNAVERAAARAALLSSFPSRAVPDLCELSVVANATGFGPDIPPLHAPIARISEVADILCESADGGILSGDRRIDIFNCLRKTDEVSFAGGVFLVVRCRDAASWSMLREKGHIVSSSGRTALLYLPRHLLGLEAATSVLEAVFNGTGTGGSACRPHLDLIGRALADLPAGHRLAMGGHHHTIDNVAGELVPAGPLRPEAPVPFYLMANAVLLRGVAAGEPVRLADVSLGHAPSLLRLRQRQDEVFFPAAGAA